MPIDKIAKRTILELQSSEIEWDEKLSTLTARIDLFSETPPSQEEISLYKKFYQYIYTNYF